MKATIMKKGTLVITPENELESYALNHWNKNHHKGEHSSTLAIEDYKPIEEESINPIEK